jgi:ABC-type nickel/cobalt efflux system permease component RcnA
VYELKQGLLSKVNTKRPTKFKIKHLTLTAFITGMVPCPGAALILVFAITQNISVAGLLAMICMAVGMGATTSIFALFAIASRNTLFRLTARRQKLFVWSHAVLSMGGAVIITSIGTLLLLGQG